MPVGTEPYIPQYITVHLGRPTANAANVTVSFADYIKNVASSEIYPTWPEAAVRANVYAQTSFALNRVYNEWYRSRGYDFDITNSTAFDQAFVYRRDIFDRISRIVDEQFNSYIRRRGKIEPLFAAYCDGKAVTCQGLSQNGTVPLANRGMSPIEILRYYYGNDIEIVRNVPVRIPAPSYPGQAIREGASGNDVQGLQIRLNRIARNYPAIPTISPVNGVYTPRTREAVVAFQRIFGLTPDGVVGSATWNRINYLYVSVKKLSELTSEGIGQSELVNRYPGVLKRGSRGSGAATVQYYLAVLARFYGSIPPVEIDGVFGAGTENAVIAFQRLFGLAQDGVVGRDTWRALSSAYAEVISGIDVFEDGVAPYPGKVLAISSTGRDVQTVQSYLAYIASNISLIPKITPDGVFGAQTETAVRTFQKLYGLEQTGTVGAATWNAIGSEYAALRRANSRA